MNFPRFRCADPVRRADAFDDARFVFELKYDGFRALAHITEGGCQLVPRRGNVYRSFRSLRESFGSIGNGVILDGEIVVLDDRTRTGANPVEARTVAEAVMEHARSELDKHEGAD